MADIHIEEFYKDAARILLQMYHSFPRKSQVFVEDISGPDTPDEYGIHSPRHQSCFACMLWLADEGFIRFQDTIRQEAIDQAVLTQSAFLRLTGVTNQETAAPTGDNAHSDTRLTSITNIELIRQALKSTSSTHLAILMEKVLFA